MLISMETNVTTELVHFGSSAERIAMQRAVPPSLLNIIIYYIPNDFELLTNFQATKEINRWKCMMKISFIFPCVLM